MATVYPLALVAGEVREVDPGRSFLNKDTGEYEPRPPKVTVLTKRGFAVVTMPQEGSPDFTVGQPFAAWVEVRDWTLNGRSGTTWRFEAFASADLVTAIFGTSK